MSQHLRPEDVRMLLAQSATDGTVVVGGQAVAIWADYFRILPQMPAMSFDLDYVATAREAKIANASIAHPHKLFVPTLDNATINTAVIEVEVPGYQDPVILDYLSGIAGVDTSDVIERAVEIDYDGLAIMVLHPLLCLESKLANLFLLPSKRTPEGIEQARLSIDIGRAYINERMNEGIAARDLLKIIERIHIFSLDDAAISGKHLYGFDVLKVVPIERITRERADDMGKFLKTRWPQILARAAQADKKFKALQARRASLVQRRRQPKDHGK